MRLLAKEVAIPITIMLAFTCVGLKTISGNLRRNIIRRQCNISDIKYGTESKRTDIERSKNLLTLTLDVIVLDCQQFD